MREGMKGRSLRILTREEVRQIDEASRRVLESVGMRSTSEKIINIFNKAGANVDRKTRTIKIPESLLREALRTAPHNILLRGRNPENDILLEGGVAYPGLGGTPVPYIKCLETGKFRRPTKKDFEETTRLGDALENIYFLMAIAGAFDVPYEVEYLHEWEALLNNTEKPIIYSCPDPEQAKIVLKMCAEVVGGIDELRKRPIACLYSETVSPLAFPTANENIIEFAKAGVPFTEGPGTMIGATGPGAAAGTLVVSNAENLAALTLSQLVNPGTPMIYAGWSSVLDPFTARSVYASPEGAMNNNVINAQMGEYYGLPTFGFAGCSDSKTLDAQAGADVMMISLLGALAGTNLLHDCGYLAGGSVGSMEMAVICNEVLGMVARVVKGMRVNEETLAVDVIKEVGPEGNFLGHKHTLKHIRDELYLPKIFDRTDQTTWLKEGSKDVGKRANAEAKRILKEHRPEPLPKDVKKRISEMVKEAERKFVK